MSRIYDVTWLYFAPIEYIYEDLWMWEHWIDWPEVIELDNDNQEFSGRVKLAKNGWVPIVEYEYEYPPPEIQYRVYYPVPILAGDPNLGSDYKVLYEHLIFTGVEISDDSVAGWVGIVNDLLDYGVPFYAVRRYE
ncbi:hypothetical protein ACFL5L_01400 [candidate division KSB1 bacterium]